MKTNVGNVRIEVSDKVIRLSQNTKSPVMLDCLLTIDEARTLGHMLMSAKAKDDFEDLL